MVEERNESNLKKKIIVNWTNVYSNNNEYKSNGDRSKSLSLKEYIGKIKPYLRDIIIDLQESD